MNIIQDFIPAGRRNRPATNPSSSLYRKIMVPKYITIHNAWSPWDAKGLNNYQKGLEAANRPASWHLSVSDQLVYQGVPFNEPAWHAGDNLGPGNTTTIGIEICDFYNSTTRTNNQALYLLAEAYSIIVVYYLINNIPTLHPFPECVVPHTKWRPASGCPSRILGRKDGWQEYLNKIQDLLRAPQPSKGLPNIQRKIGVEVNGQISNEVGYLIDNSTYVRAAFVAGLSGVKVTGHGDHIKIHTG